LEKGTHKGEGRTSRPKSGLVGHMAIVEKKKNDDRREEMGGRPPDQIIGGIEGKKRSLGGDQRESWPQGKDNKKKGGVVQKGGMWGSVQPGGAFMLVWAAGGIH